MKIVNLASNNILKTSSGNLEISLPTAQTVEIDGTNIAYTPATTLTLNANAFGAAGAGANYANIAATNATAAWSTDSSTTNAIANATGIWANNAIVSVDFSQINYPSNPASDGGLLTNAMFPASAKPTNMHYSNLLWYYLDTCGDLIAEFAFALLAILITRLNKHQW